MLSCQFCCNASVRQRRMPSLCEDCPPRGPSPDEQNYCFHGSRGSEMLARHAPGSRGACCSCSRGPSPVQQPPGLPRNVTYSYHAYHVYMPRTWHSFPVGVFEKRLMKVMRKLKLVSFSTWQMGHNCMGATYRCHTQASYSEMRGLLGVSSRKLKFMGTSTGTGCRTHY